MKNLISNIVVSLCLTTSAMAFAENINQPPMPPEAQIMSAISEALELTDIQKEKMFVLREDMKPTFNNWPGISPVETVDDSLTVEQSFEVLLAAQAERTKQEEMRDKQRLKQEVTMFMKLQTILTDEQLEKLKVLRDARDSESLKV